MKNLTAKLKNMDYKQFAIDHLEKMVFGLFAFIVLLSLVGTRWSGFAKEPMELQQLTDNAKRQILSSTWPEEKKKSFEVGSNIVEQVETLVTGVDVGKWVYGNEGPSWPLIKKKVPITEPEWMLVQDLAATSGTFILSERLPEDDFDMYDPNVYPEGEEPEEFDPRFAPRNSVGGGTFGIGAAAGAGKAGDPAGALAAKAGGAAGRGRAGRPGAGADVMPGKAGGLAQDGGLMPRGGGLGGFSSLGPTGKGRGVRFVAVRGVFPIMAQRDKIADATNQAINAQMELLEFLDFTLERQTAVLGEEGWGPWEPLNIQRAKDVLAETSDFDPDVVDSGITDNVITMPLPARGAGYWTEDVASHPQVRNYELSPEEMEREIEINQKLIEQYQQMDNQEGKRFTAKPGGFADTVLDIRGIRQDVMFNRNGQYGNDFLNLLEKEMDPDKREKALMDSIKTRVQAQGRVLLFRYFDFEVAPENVYRYRVKLTVRNPNFERPITDVIDPSVIEGETRETPWSEPSNPSYVKKDVQYFMDNVQIRGSTTDGAKFDIYQWYPETGTFINNILNVKFGQIIGGEATAHVLKPLEQSFEEAEVMFDSGDVLVDAREQLVLDRDEHPDLQLNAKQRGRIGVVDRALIMNRYGELASIDPVATAREHKRAKALLELEQKPYESLKDAIKNADSAEDAGGLDELLGARPGMAAGAGAMESGRRGRGRNPLRMQGAGAMPGAMPGGAAGAGGAPGMRGRR
ncbi:MAG: hypothetical protein O2955_06680 [Planctomycetota bacterium]|nr:hypothetical protein [Planctomycetota bacterium]MDA1212180.1 hypothetical protein [Planctomycetota bacterium]